MQSSAKAKEELSETHMLGPDTTYTAVRCGVDDQRPWLSKAPVCEQLSQYRIIHVGIMHASMPLRIARVRQSGTYFMATLSGRGEVLVDGSWEHTTPGQGCLLPAHYPNSFRAVDPDEAWTFAWVRYLEPEAKIPVGAANRPILADCNVEGILGAVQGLMSSSKYDDNPAIRQQWVKLIHGYVQQFAGPAQHDDRLWRAWEAVREEISASWDLEAIARIAHVSPEHFRRLCLKHLGRSPMKHLAFLRIQAAMQQLQETDETVESIARDVGYHAAAAFTKAFRRWTGHAPSEVRG
jgi:AraC-like DNA-binding protein